MSNDALLAHIRAMYAEVNREYLWPNMVKELNARGFQVGKERVRKLIKQRLIKANGKRRFEVTTDNNHNLRIAPDLVQRNFTPEASNQVWMSDITYLPANVGWVFFAVVIDLFSRGVLGCSMGARMESSLVIDALRMAWYAR
jgi:transposase InsO family protein